MCIYLHVYLLIYAYTWMYICIYTRHVCCICLVWVYKHTCIELDLCQTGQMVCTCVYLLICWHVYAYIWRYICICAQLESDVCIITNYRVFFWNTQDRSLTFNTYMYLYVYTHMYTNVDMYVCMHTIFINVCVHVHQYIYLNMYIYIHTYNEHRLNKTNFL